MSRLRNNESGRVIRGLDISGLGGGNSGLASIRLPDRGTAGQEALEVTVWRGHPFAKSHRSDEKFETCCAELSGVLKQWTTGENHLYVDIPIDLQGLPFVTDPRYIWETKKRPVDYAIGGLAPFASLIGSQTADFHYLMRTAYGERNPSVVPRLGNTLFETYPAASLRELLEGESIPYKGKDSDEGRKKIQDLIHIRSVMNPGSEANGEILTHDDMDAILCALVGVYSPVCFTNEELAQRLKNLRGIPEDADVDQSDTYKAPKGYRLLRREALDHGHLPTPLNVVIRNWNSNQ